MFNQNRVQKALMSSVDDATASRAALPHVNGDLYNVHVYIFTFRMKTEKATDRKDSASQTNAPLKLGQGTHSLVLS